MLQCCLSSGKLAPSRSKLRIPPSQGLVMFVWGRCGRIFCPHNQPYRKYSVWYPHNVRGIRWMLVSLSVTSYPSHFVPKSLRTHIVVPKSLRTQVISYPSHFVPQLYESDRIGRPSIFSFMWTIKNDLREDQNKYSSLTFVKKKCPVIIIFAELMFFTLTRFSHGVMGCVFDLSDGDWHALRSYFTRAFPP